MTTRPADHQELDVEQQSERGLLDATYPGIFFQSSGHPKVIDSKIS